MESRKVLACLVSMALFLGGCAPYSRTSTSVPSRPADSEVSSAVERDPRLERLLAYAARIRGFTPAMFEAAYASAREDHRRRPSAYTRLKLAMLLSHPRAPFRADERARALLRRTADGGARETASLRALAGLLLGAMDERRALERALERERVQRAALQEKLEQLKTIEQEIDRRGPPAVVPETQ